MNKKIKNIVFVFLVVLIFIFLILIKNINNQNINNNECSGFIAFESSKCIDTGFRLYNNSFEEIESDDSSYEKPSNWNINNENQEFYLINEKDGEYECNSGQYCLDANIGSEDYIYQNMEITKEEQTLSFYYNAIDEYDANLKIGINEIDAGGNIINNYEQELEFENYGEWTNVEYSFTPNENTVSVDVYFTTNDTSPKYGENILIDDVYLGSDTTYDVSTTLDYDGYIYLDSYITLLEGIPEETYINLSINQYVNIKEIYINDELVSNDIFDVEYVEEEERFTTKISSNKPLILGNDQMKIILEMNKIYEDNKEINTDYNLNYDSNYVKDISSSKITTTGNSNIEILQEIEDENEDGIASAEEKLTYKVSIANNADYPDYNININFFNLNSNDIAKKTGEKIIITDSNGIEVTDDKFKINNTNGTITIYSFPAHEEYNIVFSVYVNRQYPAIYELSNDVVVSSYNSTIENNSTTTIPLADEGIKSANINLMTDSNNNSTQIILDITDVSTEISEFDILFWTKGYIKPEDTYNFTIDLYNQNSKVDINYKYEDNMLKIYDVSPNDKIRIKFEIKNSLIKENKLTYKYKLDDGEWEDKNVIIE